MEAIDLVKSCTMPKYRPSLPIEDCYGSVGELTYYHRNGACFYKKRPRPAFPGTMRQMEQQSVHLRAIAAWQQLEPDVQKRWNSIAPAVIVHRPPFDGTTHMSGYNLFVSAYHGFARLGDEHAPEPMPWREFPPFSVSGVESVSVREGTLHLRLRCFVDDGEEDARLRLMIRLQLAAPGGGRNPGRMRTYLAAASCSAGDQVAAFDIPDYVRRWGLDLPAYTVHFRAMLLNEISGYRNIYQEGSFSLTL